MGLVSSKLPPSPVRCLALTPHRIPAVRFEEDSVTAIRTHAELRHKATVTLGHRFLLPRSRQNPRPLRGQTHSTRHCHKVSASSPHGQFPRHPRPPATRVRSPPKPPRLAHAKRPPKPSCVAAFSGHGADLPPSRATSLLRLCNQSCTDSAPHAHFSRSLPSRLSSGHLAPVPPMLSTRKVRTMFC